MKPTLKPTKGTATELFSQGSDAYQRGRRVILKLAGEEVPILDRIEYQPKHGVDGEFMEQTHATKGFQWTEVPQALALLFLDYMVWDKSGRSGKFYFSGSCSGSLAASLGDAIYGSGPITELFVGADAPNKTPRPQIKQIFSGDNVHGRATVSRDRRITVSPTFLPPDCVAIYWDVCGNKPLDRREDFERLAHRIRESLDLLTESVTPAVSVVPALPTTSGSVPTPAPKPSPPPLPKYRLEDFPEIDQYRDGIYCRLLQGLKPEEIFDSKPMRGTGTTLQRVTDYCKTLIGWIHPPDGSVLPEHFRIYPCDYTWERDMTVWHAGPQDVLTLDDVTQGTLILGATGSGKTTGSGKVLAQAFLAKHFGGIILTTKPGEGREWTGLCKLLGREGDIRWVRFDGPVKMNLLAYETQRPGAGAQLTENLVGFFRVLLSVLGNRHSQRADEGFWHNAGNQLLRNVFDVFLLAQVPLNLDRLADFVTAAPTSRPKDDEEWRSIPLFGEILGAAESNVVAADRRVLDKAKSYWLEDYPALNSQTRSCITFGFKAMLDVLRTRHFYDLLCTETTITPECVFSGAIIILDIPVKEFGDAGVLVQCAFKYLFQRAVERRQDLGDDTRPVFIFADEAQNFFTPYDTTFQQTARSSRVATVYLSQNLNNFYAHLGGGDIARYQFDSLAGNLNTRIFHCNGDMLTNEWASKMFGTWEKPVESGSASSQPKNSLNPFESNPLAYGDGRTTRREPMVFPDEFARLHSGGKRNDYHTEAYVYRVGGVFNATQLPFMKTVFQQTILYELPEQT